MTFEKLLISCLNREQVGKAVIVLNDLGYSKTYSHDHKKALFIHVYTDGEYQVLKMNDLHGSAQEYTFEQFMEKYDIGMVKKINQVKQEYSLTNSALSAALGKSRPYITKMLTIPQSEKVQKKVVQELDFFVESTGCKSQVGEPLKLSIKSEDEFKSIGCGENRFKKQWENSKIVCLQREVENKNFIINKLDDQLLAAEKVHEQDSQYLKDQDKLIVELKNENKGLNSSFDALRVVSNELRDDLRWAKDRIVCERWLFLIIIAILTAVAILT